MRTATSFSAMRCSHQPADVYEPGHGQPSFDKQFARDWLKANPDKGWKLPDDVAQKTIDIYLEGYEKLTGKPLGK